jgi:hypothetical protein
MAHHQLVSELGSVNQAATVAEQPGEALEIKVKPSSVVAVCRLTLRAALNRWRSATDEWIEATLELAGELWHARQQFAGESSSMTRTYWNLTAGQVDSFTPPAYKKAPKR